MYYKDNHTEVRLGIGIMDFISIIGITINYTLYRVIPNTANELIAEFTSDTPLTVYPDDGDYKLTIANPTFETYSIYITVSDKFIAEYVTQIIDTICNCGCSDPVNPCTETKMGNIALKRQKLFNITNILPYTIKPFSYGQASLTNEKLRNIYQIYYTASTEVQRIELGKEFFDYYITGTNALNMKLFKDIIALNYYAIYYYARTELLPTSLGNMDAYSKQIDAFFNYKVVTTCLGSINAVPNIEELINSDNPFPMSIMIHYWQLLLGMSLEDIIPIFTEATYIDKPSETLEVFNLGVEIVNTSIGRQVFAIVNTELVSYVITDIETNNDITALFNSHYFVDLGVLLYVSKVPYSLSTFNIKIKKQTP